MPSNILKFELNQPVTIALSTISTMDVFNDYGKPQVLFALADNRRLYATPELARKTGDLLELRVVVIRRATEEEARESAKSLGEGLVIVPGERFYEVEVTVAPVGSQN
jgi:hypothetical protein